MDLLPYSQPWTVHRAAWTAAVTRLHGEPTAGSLVASVLTPLVDHFERAWLKLGRLAAVAAPFAPPPGSRPMPIQHLAAFALDDLLDVFRGAANEVQTADPRRRAVERRSVAGGHPGRGRTPRPVPHARASGGRRLRRK